MKYFKLEEFDCPCCKQGEMKPEFLVILDNAREMAGVPFRINSGFRCEKHNKEVGGKPTSSHLFGYACDISADTSYKRYKVLKGLILAGFTRIGIGSNFIHADSDSSKPPEALWLY